MFPPQGAGVAKPWTIADWFGGGYGDTEKVGYLLPNFIASDFKVTGNVMLVAGIEGKDASASTHGRVQSSHYGNWWINSYWGEIIFHKNLVRIKKSVDGDRTVLASASFTVDCLTWYSIIFEIDGTSLYYQANSTSVSATDVELTGSSPILCSPFTDTGCFATRNMKMSTPSSPPYPSINKPVCLLSEIVGKGKGEEPLRVKVADNPLISAHTAIIPTDPETGKTVTEGLLPVVVEARESDIEEIKEMTGVKEISRIRFKEEVRKLEADLKLERKHNIAHILKNEY